MDGSGAEEAGGGELGRAVLFHTREQERSPEECELPGESDEDDENLGGKEKMQKPGARSMPGVFWEQEHVWCGWRNWRQRVAREKSRDVAGGES